MLKGVLHFLNVVIWEIHLKNLSPVKALAMKILRVVILAARGFMKNDGQKKASVLTYYSLLNIVPIIAVIFGVAKGFGFDKLIEKQILEMAQKGKWSHCPPSFVRRSGEDFQVSERDFGDCRKIYRKH